MRLIKLMAYSLLGFVLYEMYQGLTHPPTRSTGSSRRLDRALNEDAGRMANLMGTGRGTRVEVQDADGAHTSRIVGRGIVS